jgi:hypothetical protein
MDNNLDKYQLLWKTNNFLEILGRNEVVEDEVEMLKKLLDHSYSQSNIDQYMIEIKEVAEDILEATKEDSRFNDLTRGNFIFNVVIRGQEFTQKVLDKDLETLNTLSERKTNNLLRLVMPKIERASELEIISDAEKHKTELEEKLSILPKADYLDKMYIYGIQKKGQEVITVLQKVINKELNLDFDYGEYSEGIKKFEKESKYTTMFFAENLNHDGISYGINNIKNHIVHGGLINVVSDTMKSLKMRESLTKNGLIDFFKVFEDKYITDYNSGNIPEILKVKEIYENQQEKIDSRKEEIEKNIEVKSKIKNKR